MKNLARAAVVALLLLVTAGCAGYSTAHDFNAPAPTVVHHLRWERLETVGNFPAANFTCWHGTGLYELQDSTNMMVNGHDQACAPDQTWLAAGYQQ